MESRTAVMRRALRNGRLRRVLAAYLVFNIHEWANWIALLVWAYAIDGVRTASAIALIQLLPSALLASPVSSFLERKAGRRALGVGYALQALSQLVLAVTLLLGLPFLAVATAAAAASVAVTLTRPAHNSLLPRISNSTGELTAGNAASGAVEAAAAFLGPLVSAVLVVLWRPGGVVLSMALLTVLAAVVTWRGLEDVDEHPEQPRTVGPRAPGRAALRDRDARLLTALVGAEYALVGMMDILLVVLAIDLLAMSEAGPGLLNSALGVGGIAGVVLTVTLIARQRLAPALAVGALAAGGAFAVAGLVDAVSAAVVLIAISGAGKVFFDVASRTFVQRLMPDRMLTGIFGLQESVMMAGLALGTVATPVLVELLGARAAFVVGGLFLPVAVIGAFLRLRRLDAQTVVPLEVLRLVSRVPILAVLSPRVLERLALEARPMTAAAGTVLVAEGESGDTFYVVAEGEVVVSRHGEPIRRLGAAGWFGELALLRGAPRSATVTAATEVKLWTLGREEFLAAVGVGSGARSAADAHARQHYR